MFNRKKKPDPDPKLCDCSERTQVDGQGDKYWPKDASGKPTGHDPTCEYYKRPPGYGKAQKITR
jgi:hypothetical protein